MKDHELRELVNKLTDVARKYPQTQQLREQISHLIVPPIKMLRERCETNDLILANGDKVIESLTALTNSLRKEIEVAKAEVENAKKECLEQARLNGMGAERELKQLAQIESLNRQLDFEVKQRIELRKQVFCDHHWEFYDNKLDLNPGEERTFYYVCQKCDAKKPMMDDPI